MLEHSTKEGKLMSQTCSGLKANINSNSYAKVERAEVTPTIITLKKILKALNLKSSDILSF